MYALGGKIDRANTAYFSWQNSAKYKKMSVYVQILRKLQNKNNYLTFLTFYLQKILQNFAIRLQYCCFAKFYHESSWLIMNLEINI
jgi:hypothetical protein